MRIVRSALLRFHLRIALLLAASGIWLPGFAEVERILVPTKNELSYPNHGFKITVNLDKGSRSIVIQRRDSKLTIPAEEIGDFPIDPSSVELQVSKDLESKPWPSELRLVFQSFPVGRPGDLSETDWEAFKFVVVNGQYAKRIREHLGTGKHRGAEHICYSKAAGEKERVITSAEFQGEEAEKK